MSALIVDEVPELRSPTLVAAFAGWPDAGEVASGAIRHLTRKLRPRRFARIDPDGFYVFTETRPNTVLSTSGQRGIEWPANDFMAWRDSSGISDLVLFQAHEPNINWRGYIDAVASLMAAVNVSKVIVLGGTYDAVSHRGAAVMTGNGTTPESREILKSFGIESSAYQGPSSIQSALLAACQSRELPAASLWGHSPHYVRSSPNPKVMYAMLQVLRRWLEVDLDLVELRIAAEQLESRVEEAMADNIELRAYVEQLGIHEQPTVVDPLDAPTRPAPPSADEVLRELEELLKRSNDEDNPPS